MKEIVQQKMWVPTRGVELLLPPHADPLSAGNTAAGEKAVIESERLRQINQDGTLRKRYPTPEVGREFMENVCFARRDELLQLAQEASTVIKGEWEKISDKPVAIVLFGSVAKGTAKHVYDNDPSNIDLTVIGDVTLDETTSLYDAIRPYRTETRQRILESCTNSQESEEPVANLGVSVQHISKLSNGHYSGIVSYLGSGAFPLSDEAGIWERIESEALLKLAAERTQKKEKSPYHKSYEWTRARITAEKASEKVMENQTKETVVFTQQALFSDGGSQGNTN